jgi:hypothetical protein
MPLGSDHAPSTPVGAARAATGVGRGPDEKQAVSATEMPAITTTILIFISFSRRFGAKSIRVVAKTWRGTLVKASLLQACGGQEPAFRQQALQKCPPFGGHHIAEA